MGHFVSAIITIFFVALVVSRPVHAKAPQPKTTPAATPVATPGPSPTAQPKLSVDRNAPPSSLPFWKSNAKVAKRIKDERAVVVSVRREDFKQGSADLVRFTMLGAGWVKRPKDFCFKIAQSYPRLKDVSDHFREVIVNPLTQEVFIVVSALGYQERMILKIQPVSEDWRDELQWEVVWGHFTGMKGVIGYEKIDESTTEVTINAKFEAAELPLPRILMSFALEIITQKVAEKMRSFIEAQPLVSPSPTPSLKSAR